MKKKKSGSSDWGGSDWQNDKDDVLDSEKENGELNDLEEGALDEEETEEDL